MASNQKQIEMLMEDIYMSGYGLDWEDSEGMATQLNFLDYRKVPKDSVILSKERYFRLCNQVQKEDLFASKQVVETNAKIETRKQASADFAEKVKVRIKELKKRYHEDCINGIGDEEYNGITEADIDELLNKAEEE